MAGRKKVDQAGETAGDRPVTKGASMPTRGQALGSAIARRLRQVIEKRDLTVTQAAEQVGLSRLSMHTLLGGEGHRSSAETLDSVAQALKVRAAWLVFGDGEMESL